MATHPNARLRSSTIEGTGLFAAAPIRQGEIIWRMEPPYVAHHSDKIQGWPKELQTRFFKYSVQIDHDWHAGLADGSTPLEPFAFTNHSCEANTWWADTGVLVARQSIAVADEITYDYATSETRSGFGVAHCICGRSNCRGKIGPDDYRKLPELQQRFAGNIMPYLRSTSPVSRHPWWLGGSLNATNETLQLAGQDVASWAAQHGTPLYLYDRKRIEDQVAGLRTALGLTGKPYRIHYAMKANRCAEVLATMRAQGDVGIDACSPREVALALQSGFVPAEISVTASMLSDRDFNQFAAQGVHLNLDSPSGIARYAKVVPPGTAIGLRIDPQISVGYGDTGKLNYCGGKLGLVASDVPRVAQLATDAGLVINTLHMHLGWGIAQRDTSAVAAALQQLADLARTLPSVHTLNLGGGLGARLQPEDLPLDPLDWGRLVGRALHSLDVTLACEPGTLLVSQAGLLVVQVNTAHIKLGQNWLGVDAGLGINVYAAHYAAPLSVLSVARPLAQPDARYHIAGNINEAADVLGKDVALPLVHEGDLLAFFPAGAYGASMASDHCLRGQFAEVLV